MAPSSDKLNNGRFGLIKVYTKDVQQGVQKFGQTKLKFAVGRDCIQKHFSKYEIEKTRFWVSEVRFKLFFRYECHTFNFDFFLVEIFSAPVI